MQQGKLYVETGFPAEFVRRQKLPGKKKLRINFGPSARPLF